jgi:hypothetical protein
MGRFQWIRTIAAVACLSLLMFTSSSIPADGPSPKATPFDRLRVLLGSWIGEGHGVPGTSAVEREYQWILDGRFIEAHNRSIYPPQQKNAKGEVHEHRDYFSWDRHRRRFVLRQFHVEGFVNQYVADSTVATSDSLVFTSEAIENIPPGFRARETYRLLGPDEFIERFELAEPGGAFELYSETRLRRKTR